MADDKIPHAHLYYTINPLKWVKLLIENKGVSRSNLWLAIKITLISIISSPFQILDRILVAILKPFVKQDKEPVFIIGHWRSGTTYLHYLMAKDKRFGYLSLYQAFLPNISTIGGRFIKMILKPLVPGKRPQDNIEVDIDLPAEEENAISTFSFESASHSFWFPKNESYYDSYSLFDNVTEQQRSKWQVSYKRLMTKIALDFPGKKPLIKNPHNSGRVKELLALYPNAKFIHIYRNPFKVLPSTYLMYDMVVKTQFLQDFSQEELHDKIFYYYKSSMQNLLRDIKLIPKQNLYKLKYEEFELNPLSELEAIYKQFGLDHFEEALPDFTAYVNEKKVYTKNNHSSSPIDQQRILTECNFAFTELGYSTGANAKKEQAAKRIKARTI